ncbi:MAG: hypothetical protein ACHP7A_06445 [Caulobacterales bacterium]
MNAREKVLRLKSWLLSMKPEDEETAQQLQILASLSPLLMKAIPDDPAEVDRYLQMIAWATVRCRSDDAPRIELFELVEGEWSPVEMEVTA